MPKFQKFVILAMPRTGSSLFTKLLNSHPEINCYFAILLKTLDFNKDYSNLDIETQNQINTIKKIDAKFWDLDCRYQYPLEFTESVLNLTIDSINTGFKLMLSQHESLVEELIKRKDYKIILLKRNNLLAVFSSNEVTKALNNNPECFTAFKLGKVVEYTKEEIILQNTKIKKPKIEFKASSFEKYVRGRLRKYNLVEKLLKENNRSFLEVEYNQIRTEAGRMRVLEFLDVDSKQNLNYGIQKLNSDDILSRFSNPEVVSDYLEKKELQEWAFEKVKSSALV